MAGEVDVVYWLCGVFRLVLCGLLLVRVGVMGVDESRLLKCLGVISMWFVFVGSFLLTAGALLNCGVNVIFCEGIVGCTVDVATV